MAFIHLPTCLGMRLHQGMKFTGAAGVQAQLALQLDRCGHRRRAFGAMASTVGGGLGLCQAEGQTQDQGKGEAGHGKLLNTVDGVAILTINQGFTMEKMWMPPPQLPSLVPITCGHMRFRLAHQLSLLLVGTSLLAVVGLTALTATQLRSGFTDYLRAQDEARLARFAEGVRQSIERHGLEGLATGHEALMAPSLGGPPLRREPLGDRTSRPDERAPRGFSVTTPEGLPVWGRRPPRDLEVLQRPIEVSGRTVAIAHFTPRPDPSDEEANARFLKRQFAGLAGLGLAMAAMAALVAIIVARRWLPPKLPRTGWLRGNSTTACRRPRGAFTTSWTTWLRT